MSVFTPKRVVLFAALLLAGVSAFASRPSPRMNARMAFDEKNGVGVLFGGRGIFDGATQLVHDSDETWFWNGARWIQNFPLDRPAPRNLHSMLYDTKRERVVLFGGRREPVFVKGDATLYNDTWVFQNGNWTNLAPASAPPARYNSAMVYDVAKDRIILVGGTALNAEQNPEPIYDTWEFDGASWTQVGAAGTPKVVKPVLAYDAKRKETILLGIDATDLSNVMYRYDSTAKTWTKLPAATTLPTCLNEGHMVYQPTNEKVYWMGGICNTGTQTLDEVFEWDGEKWTKITTTNALIRLYGQAVAFDNVRENVVIFGGSNVGEASGSSATSTYARGTFRFPATNPRPTPRSLSGFQTDPITGNIWLYGGLHESGNAFLEDFWGYRGQQWFPISTADAPGTCVNPLAAYDSDRGRLVITCLGSSVSEWESATFAWKSSNPTKPPGQRRFANMVYDKKLKKTVMFGGYNTTGNYTKETWTWDGTNWAQVKTKDSETPSNRGLMAMWYDPLLEKTVLYGGIGRPNINSKITRYSDMWSFDGTRWTKLSVTETPGQRLGAQITVNPVTGKVLLFGGLLAEGAETDSLSQTFVNDTWEWDGKTSKWAKLSPTRAPDVRENGMLAWDPVLNEIVLFGGYAYGFYRSDVWAWNGVTWRPLVDQGVRRRTAGGTPPPAPPPTQD
jgi:N-acetylneuraminic acid mutarotase